MQSINYCYIIATVCIVYLIILLSKQSYRLLLPSVLHTVTWLVTAILLFFELKGLWVSFPITNSAVNLTTEYILYLVVSSIIGFTLAHLIGDIRKERMNVRCIDSNTISNVLNRFKWIPYLCFIIGVLLFVFLISTIGIFGTFGEFREYAVVDMTWDGFSGFVKQISGHVNIFSGFYLILLGYKHGQEKLNIKEFLKYALLCSTINIAIGGRMWLITSTLPYIVALIYSREFSHRDKKSLKKDKRALFSLILIIAAVFAVMGFARDDRDIYKSFMDKFLYFTDGAKMTNMIFNQYPPGSFELEYGKSEFLRQFIESPMDQKFYSTIADDGGLSSMVQSAIPPLYYDFGYYGGILMWGVFCFIIEFMTIKLLSTQKLLGILLFVQLSQLLFLVPIFDVFSVNMQTFEWLLIIYFFRRPIFRSINGCQKYI